MTKIRKNETESIIYFLEKANTFITRARFGVRVLRQAEETLKNIEYAQAELEYIARKISDELRLMEIKK